MQYIIYNIIYYII